MDTSFLKLVPALNSEDVANSIVHIIGAPPHVEITQLTIRPKGETFWLITNRSDSKEELICSLVNSEEINLTLI